MTLQYDTYLTLSTLFNSQPFSLLFNLDSTDDIIFLTWQIQFQHYEIQIFNNGEINCSISNSGSQDRINNCELETIYNMINRAHIEYKDKNKLWRYVSYLAN